MSSRTLAAVRLCVRFSWVEDDPEVGLKRRALASASGMLTRWRVAVATLCLRLAPNSGNKAPTLGEPTPFRAAILGQWSAGASTNTLGFRRPHESHR
jgi:hypothetical protein